MNSHFWENELDIDVIMVKKFNDMENDAELDGQWSNLMVKERFYEEQVARSANIFFWYILCESIEGAFRPLELALKWAPWGPLGGPLVI